MYALKHAHQVRDKTGAEVFEFYMDMRAFGKAYEEFYQRVQEEGIVMVRGRGAEVEVLPSGKLRVKGEDANLGKVVVVEVDMVILNTAIEPVHDADKVSALFGLGRTADGFFAERHPKLAPVQTNTEGIFLAGTCQGPRDVPDTVAHAGAAAVEALRLLVRGEVVISPIVAQVNRDKCVGCGDCLLVCPYTAITRVEDKAQVNPALCQGAGPAPRPAHPRRSLPCTLLTKSSSPRWTGCWPCWCERTIAMSEPFEPRIVAFLCNWCSYAAADSAGVARMKSPANIMPVRVMCSGRVSPK